MFAEDATNGYNELATHQLSGTKVFVLYTNVDGSGAANTGDEQFNFEGYITSLEQTAGVEDNVGYSMTIEMSGAVVREVIA